MKMKDEYEGKTLEGAMGKASADLGIPEAELHYEVLEQGRKGLLGLGMKNVRIRVMRPVEHLTDREILNGEEPAGARVEAVAELPAPGPAEAAEGGQGRPDPITDCVGWSLQPGVVEASSLSPMRKSAHLLSTTPQ